MKSLLQFLSISPRLVLVFVLVFLVVEVRPQGNSSCSVTKVSRDNMKQGMVMYPADRSRYLSNDCEFILRPLGDEKVMITFSRPRGAGGLVDMYEDVGAGRDAEFKLVERSRSFNDKTPFISTKKVKMVVRPNSSDKQGEVGFAADFKFEKLGKCSVFYSSMDLKQGMVVYPGDRSGYPSNDCEFILRPLRDEKVIFKFTRPRGSGGVVDLYKDVSTERDPDYRLVFAGKTFDDTEVFAFNKKVKMAVRPTSRDKQAEIGFAAEFNFVKIQDGGDSSGDSSTILIIGVVAGLFAIAALIGGLLCYFYGNRYRNVPSDDFTVRA